MHAKHAVNIEMNDRSGRVIRCENASAYEVPNAEMIDSPTACWLGLTQPPLPTSALRKMQCQSATIRMGMAGSSPAMTELARLRGLEGFSDLRSLSINELADKVFTTEAAWTSRLWRFWLVLVALCEFEPSQHDRRHTNRGVEMG
jgi:hypothetical protein